MPKLLVICGPTGSGKTDFAHSFALENKGEIINCDSMQIYNEISIITASPSIRLKSEVPYHLYNFHSVASEFSVAKYLTLASSLIYQVIDRGNLPIIVGGTGMYINSLLYGFNNIPEISNEIRENTRSLHKAIGQEKFFETLKNIDPISVSRINLQDTQRSLRAFEVLKQTGKSIFTFQNENNTLPLPDLKFKIVFLNPERSLLHNICNQRLIDIFNNGALNEAKNVKDKFSPLSTPAAKAIGLKELIAYLDNECSFEEATETAQTRTRNYAKRQVTWFKHQLKEKIVLEYSSLTEFNQIKKDFSL